MDLDLSADQVALRDGIAALLTGRFDSRRIRDGFDREMFEELRDAGVFSLRADGFAWADCVVVFEQLGRACVPGPLIGSLLAGAGIVGIVERAAPTWIEHLDVLESLIVLDDDGATTVDPRALDADSSSWPLDPLTPVARVNGLPTGERFDAEVTEWRRAGTVLTAAFLLGIADRCAELAVTHANARVQFGRPIGGFQAVKHLCADMVTRTEVARAAVYAAGAHLDDAALRGLDRDVAGAKVVAADAALANGKSATQIHGGMGFTWEVDVHLYLKRAWVLDTHFGSADSHADAVASTVARGGSTDNLT
ncbi:MAG: acyl-CoA dehydrogenase family protein [Actinomycetota bacterium]